LAAILAYALSTWITKVAYLTNRSAYFVGIDRMRENAWPAAANSDSLLDIEK
jgi:hypothetical protein